MCGVHTDAIVRDDYCDLLTSTDGYAHVQLVASGPEKCMFHGVFDKGLYGHFGNGQACSLRLAAEGVFYFVAAAV